MNVSNGQVIFLLFLSKSNFDRSITYEDIR